MTEYISEGEITGEAEVGRSKLLAIKVKIRMRNIVEHPP